MKIYISGKIIGFEINKEYFTTAENRVLQERKEV